MTDHVYHFTSSTYLPWIMESGELRPGWHQIVGWPVDFLWATVNPGGTRTAIVMGVGEWGDHNYNRGNSALVRLTLPGDDFERWPDIVERFSQYTREYVQRLEDRVQRLGETDTTTRWRARATPLPLSRIIAAEAKTFNTSWQTIKLRDACLQSDNNPQMRGLMLNYRVYTSVKGPLGYLPMKMSPGQWYSLNPGKPADQ